MGEIRENQQVKLYFVIEDGTEKELTFTIKKFEGDRISLNFTDETLEYIDFLNEGCEVLAKIFTPLGIKVFDSIVLDSPLEDEFVIEYIEQAEQVQRRNFIREEYKTKIIIQRLRENIITQTIDIGGGGIKFFYEGEFEENEKVSALLYIPVQTKSITIEATVIKNAHFQKYEHALIYDRITETDRAKIIKFCYELQLKKLQD